MQTLFKNGIFPIRPNIETKGKFRFLFLIDLILGLSAVITIITLSSFVINSYINDSINKSEILSLESETEILNINCNYALYCVIVGSYSYEPCSNLPNLNITISTGESLDIELFGSKIKNDGYKIYFKYDILLSEIPEGIDIDLYNSNMIILTMGSDKESLASYLSGTISKSLEITVTSKGDAINNLYTKSYKFYLLNKIRLINSDECPQITKSIYASNSCYAYELQLNTDKTLLYRDRVMTKSQVAASISGLLSLWGMVSILSISMKKIILYCFNNENIEDYKDENELETF